jgi:hypothetical protein
VFVSAKSCHRPRSNVSLLLFYRLQRTAYNIGLLVLYLYHLLVYHSLPRMCAYAVYCYYCIKYQLSRIVGPIWLSPLLVVLSRVGSKLTQTHTHTATSQCLRMRIYSFSLSLCQLNHATDLVQMSLSLSSIDYSVQPIISVCWFYTYITCWFIIRYRECVRMQCTVTTVSNINYRA